MQSDSCAKAPFATLCSSYNAAMRMILCGSTWIRQLPRSANHANSQFHAHSNLRTRTGPMRCMNLQNPTDNGTHYNGYNLNAATGAVEQARCVTGWADNLHQQQMENIAMDQHTARIRGFLQSTHEESTLRAGTATKVLC